MDDSTIKVLESGNENDIIKLLNTFNQGHARVFQFQNISKEIKNKFSKSASKLLLPSSQNCWTACLETVRIISRDKNDIDEIASTDLIKPILFIAGLHSDSFVDSAKQDESHTFIHEAQKTLYNMVINSSQVQNLCRDFKCAKFLIKRMKNYKKLDLPSCIMIFDMKLLFLISSFCIDVRAEIRNDYNGVLHLSETLSHYIHTDSMNEASKHVQIIALNKEQSNLICEILKILFNITFDLEDSKLDEEEEAVYMKIVDILRGLLVCETENPAMKHEIIANVINLLTNMPSSSFQKLVTSEIQSCSLAQDNKSVEYDGMNVEAILEILNFLELLLDKETPNSNAYEQVAPVLACLCKCSQRNQIIRKFIRSKVLPPLKDVHNRPEDGTSIRNKLCKMMTSPNINLKKLAAELIFTLCKHSVKRFVKYTGYGNAAGLLASRGLMLGNTERSSSFSSESDDSETEEYASNKDKINPILGCYEKPHTNPLADMCDEQKEYEAMKLVNMMDKLAREKIIQPTKIGEDGKPHPVEHILELQENHQSNVESD